MPARASAYYQCVVGLGIFFLIDGLWQFSTQDLPRFWTYLVLALLSATWKVRVPGFEASVSAVFAFILIGIANYSLGEAMAIAFAATLAQCIWRPRTRVTARRTVFSIASVIIALAVAYNPANYWLSQGLKNAPGMLPVAALVFFVVNTGLVSGIIALTQTGTSIWRHIAEAVVPYYVAGVLIASAVIVAERLWGWQWGLLAAPLLYLASNYYRTHLERRHGPGTLKT